MPTEERTWVPGEIITASKLNYIEDFIQGINGNFIPINGTDAQYPVTGNVNYVPDSVDITQSNNGVTETVWPSVNRINDINGKKISRFETKIDPNGDIKAIMCASNYDENLIQHENKMELIVHKDGTNEVYLTAIDAWKRALGLSGTHTLENALYQTIEDPSVSDPLRLSQPLSTSLQVSSGYQLRTEGKNCTWYSGRDFAFIKNTKEGATDNYIPTISMATYGGDSWEIGTKGDKTLRFTYVPKTTYTGQTYTDICYIYFDKNGLFSGTAAIAKTIKTPNTGGYITDDYGNFKHQSSASTTNTWNIQNTGGTNKFSVNFESGNTSIFGTLGVSDATTINSTLTTAGILTVNSGGFLLKGGNVKILNNGGYFVIDRTDAKPSDIPSTTNSGNYYYLLVLRDIGTDSSNPHLRAFIRQVHRDDGREYLDMSTARIVNSTEMWNFIKLGLTSDGLYRIELPGGNATASTGIAAWRSALGLGTMATQNTTVLNSYLPLSGGTLTNNLTGTNFYGNYFVAYEHIQVRRDGDTIPLVVKSADIKNRAFIGVTTSNRFTFNEYVTAGGAYETYNLPVPTATNPYDILTTKAVKYGSVSIGSINGNKCKNGTIPFGVTYSSNPTVVVGLGGGALGEDAVKFGRVSARAQAVSTTQFTYQVDVYGSENVSNVVLYWIAIGPL